MTTTTTTFTLDRLGDAHHAAARSLLQQSGLLRALNLSADDKAVLSAVLRGETVQVADLHRAIVAGLGVAITRRGQSMARRRDREALMALYNLLPTADAALPVANSDSTLAALQRRVDTLLRENAALRHEQSEDLRAALGQIASLEHFLNVAQMSAPTVADQAVADFTYGLLTDAQRQRVSDFRTGFRAGQSA